MKNKIGRNDPCHCGSGKKFKKCCIGVAVEDDDGLGSDKLSVETSWSSLMEGSRVDAFHNITEILHEEPLLEKFTEYIEQNPGLKNKFDQHCEEVVSAADDYLKTEAASRLLLPYEDVLPWVKVLYAKVINETEGKEWDQRSPIDLMSKTLLEVSKEMIDVIFGEEPQDDLLKRIEKHLEDNPVESSLKIIDGFVLGFTELAPNREKFLLQGYAIQSILRAVSRYCAEESATLDGAP
jgi:hypothetical protein